MNAIYVVDKCPSCHSKGTLFIGVGGYLTCSFIGCPEPGVGRAIAKLLADNERMKAEIDKKDTFLTTDMAVMEIQKAELDELKQQLKDFSIWQIGKLKVEPDDILIVKFPNRISDAAMAGVTEKIKECFGTQKVVVFDENVDLQIITIVEE